MSELPDRTTTAPAPVRASATPKALRGALLRYRVMAWVVGVMLLVLVFVAMPLKYFGDNAGPIAVIGPLHGFLYIVYLLFALDLAMRCRFGVGKMLLVMIAGTVPFLSFVIEHVVTKEVRARIAATAD